MGVGECLCASNQCFTVGIGHVPDDFAERLDAQPDQILQYPAARLS